MTTLEALTTCDVCEYTWDAATWTRCPRCMGTRKAYEPTRSEIDVACLAIQKTWSPREEDARRAPAYRRKPVETDHARQGRRTFTTEQTE